MDTPHDKRRGSNQNSQRRRSNDHRSSTDDGVRRNSAVCGGRWKCILIIVLGVFVALGAGLGVGFLVYTLITNAGSTAEPADDYLSDVAIQTDDNADDEIVVEEVTARKVEIDSADCGKLSDKAKSLLLGNFDSARKKRIVGGDVSSLLRFPWQVSLWTRGHHTCGGSIISSNWIVTAAHCTHPYPFPQNWTVYAGADSISEMELKANNTQTSALSDVVQHPRFNPTTYDNDISLMRMERNLIMKEQTSPVCLPSSNEEIPPGRECSISGWGTLSEGGPMPDGLQEATVRIMESRICNGGNWLMGLVSDVMICAGTEDGSMDACQGDSGGPLSCIRKSTGQFYLPGLVSWGIGCGEPRMPGVYTDVAPFKPWVLESIQNVELRYSQI